VECCRVAERLHDRLVADGLTPFAKTSGAKGMQLYCAITTIDPAASSAYAKRLAQQLRPRHPGNGDRGDGQSSMPRPGVHRLVPEQPRQTTIAPCSLRGRDHATVSTPITWDEVRRCRHARDLVFTAEDVLERVDDHGDLLADLASTRAALPHE
jgi:bifunctional non-homologous end joining protein LigD